jgi:hypothetical protein
MASGPYQSPNSIIDFTTRFYDVLNTVVGNRMRQLGVPEDMIGIRNYLGLDEGPFVRFASTQIGGNVNPYLIPGRQAGIALDHGIFDAAHPNMANISSWASATLRDRMDAAIVHEYIEATLQPPFHTTRALCRQVAARRSDQALAGYHDADYAWSEADSDRVSPSSGVSTMIHYLYVGHFEKDRGVMKLRKRQSDDAPQPVLVRPLDMATVRELLEERGIAPANIPEDWRLWIDEEGFIVCDAYTRSQDAIDFLRQLSTKTGCDVLYDGMVAFAPDELTFAGDESERRPV